METIAFLSSLMLLSVFVALFWLDRTKGKEENKAERHVKREP